MSDDIDRRTEEIRLMYTSAAAVSTRSRKMVLRDVEFLLAHIALLRAAQPLPKVGAGRFAMTPELRAELVAWGRATEGDEDADDSLIEYLNAGKVGAGDAPDTSQDWARLDGATAFHLIERHSDNWAEAGLMMHAWRDASVAAQQKGAGDAVDAARYRWLLNNYARGDGYNNIDAALNDGEADKYLSPAIDAAMSTKNAEGGEG